MRNITDGVTNLWNFGPLTADIYVGEYKSLTGSRITLR